MDRARANFKRKTIAGRTRARDARFPFMRFECYLSATPAWHPSASRHERVAQCEASANFAWQWPDLPDDLRAWMAVQFVVVRSLSWLATTNVP